MGYLEQHTTNRQVLKGGWIMVLIANAALVILTL